MKIIIDSNVFFSALIKDSLTRRIILEYDGFFLFPEFIFKEMEKHIGYLLKKSKMSSKDFELLLKMLLEKVRIVPMDDLNKYREKAYSIVKNIDINDVIFVACALAFRGSVIWSDDKKLKRQDKVRVVNTAEMHEILFNND